MRVFQRGIGHILTERPFQDGPGARLYVAAGDPTDIIYRPNRAFNPKHLPLQPVLTRDLAVASVDSPTAELVYSLPPELIGVQLSCQVRTFADDYENETIYRPVVTGSDGGGDQSDTIQGTGLVLTVEKLDGGGMLVTFAYTASASGLQPTSFALVKTSGAGTVADVVIDATGDRVDQIQVDALTDGVTYEFDIEARNGAIAVVLDSLTFTADAAGPADPSSVVATPY